jgi:translation initiation factor 5B
MGVGVAASTLGSLEALLSFLDSSKIPVSYVSVGPVSKDDITKALKSVLADDPAKRRKEYACMLAFDVKILPDAQKYAEDNGVKIFTANIIYHLFDYFVKFVKECEEERRVEEGKNAIFPCIIQVHYTFRLLKLFSQSKLTPFISFFFPLQPIQFFNKADPIIMGVDVV